MIEERSPRGRRPVRRTTERLAALPAKPAATTALLVAILLCAGLVRLLRSRAGLPYLHDWDEPQIASRALHMMQTGDYNPHFFQYGSLMIYLNLMVDIAHYLFLMARPEGSPGSLSNLDGLRTYFDTGWAWTVSHPSFYFWNRCLTAAMGTASVALAWLLARRLCGRWGGIAAAAFLAGLEVHVGHSALVTPNVPVSFLALVATLFSLRHMDAGRGADLVAALAACGLAASTKYNAAVCLVAPLAALVSSGALRRPRARGGLVAAVLLVPPAAFLIGTPYAFLDLPSFLGGVGYQVREYAARGHGEATVGRGLPNLSVQIAFLYRYLGLTGSALGLLGVVEMLRSRAGRLILTFPLLYAAFMVTTRVSFHRNFVALYPFAAVGVGCGAVALRRIWSRAAAGWGRAGAAARPAVAGLVAITCGVSLWAAGGKSWRRATRPETRSEAMVRAGAIASEAGGVPGLMGIAEEARIHPLDLGRLGREYVVASLLELVCSASRFDLIVTAESYSVFDPRNERDAEGINELVARALLPVHLVGARAPLRLDALGSNPAILIAAPRLVEGRPPLHCSEPILPTAMPRAGGCDVAPSGELRIPVGGAARTPALLMRSGDYLVGIRARGSLSRRQHLRLSARVRDHDEAASEPLVEETIVLTSEMRDHMLRFTAPRDTLVELELELADEPYLDALVHDVNVYLESARFIGLEGG